MASPDSAAAAAAAAALAQMNQLGGPILIGSLLSSIFYGVTLLQTYLYYDKYGSEDSWLYLGFVGFLTALDSFAVILNINSMWFFFISNYGNPLIFLIPAWTYLIPIAVSVLIGSMVQWFYAYLGRRRVLAPGLIAILATVSLVTMTAYVALAMMHGLSIIPKITWLSTTSLACSLAADILIAATMILYFSKGAQKGFRRTDHILRKLMVYTINTGMVTTICNIITLILGLQFPTTFLNTLTFFLLSKCYMNSMLAFLNARESLRAHAGTVHSFNLHNLPHSTSAGDNEATTKGPARY
ncbi:hypothetical protein GGX14DRAFT_577802 [Mycena pura]|uniref:DUF6534 domain-containing protein n=1 Tax=Mycena pura TaxID=153505 RepID=A0AAD6UQY2_9AGAR|nr:hypothetical protein GGX14DRAFT_577802 [Mycena pura]